MGWLDNSTNNIILDAVLTDYGRSALAANNNSFSIAKFALGDDEVDYGVISKYGRTIGKEKIEKNTPVFEAYTNQNLALKYRLVSVQEPLIYLPKLSASPAGTISIVTQSQNVAVAGNDISKAITVAQNATGGTAITPSLVDATFDVYVPSLFLQISQIGGSSSQKNTSNPNSNGIILYNLPSQSAAGLDSNRYVSFTIAAAVGLGTTQFSVYGKPTTTGKSIINTFIRVVGTSSGTSINIPVSITGSAT